MDVQFQERKRFNDEIERTFIMAAIFARDIQTFNQTERGNSLLNLYEGFFSNFSLLVILTSDLPHLRQAQDAVNKAKLWIEGKSVADYNEKRLKERCDEGVGVFMAYKKVLSEQSVISLPNR